MTSIRENGLTVDSLTAMAGAAGGPKWLVLAALDKLLFSDWLTARDKPLPLVGSSIGSWRFAAAAQANPVAAINTLEHLYIEQQFSDRPDIAEVTAMGRHILGELLGDTGAQAILDHQWARLHIITCHCQGRTSSDHPLRLGAGFAEAFLANSLSRRYLARYLHRHVFADQRYHFEHAAFPGFHNQLLALTADSLPEALLASGSIPFVLEQIAINNEQGYRDGGLIDYHMDLPLAAEGVVLMPHFSHRRVTGWLDKHLRWRKPTAMDHHLVIHPSDAWIASLPNGKIPDRQDFNRYRGDYQGRLNVWRNVVKRSEELADCFASRLARNDWLAHIEPLRP